MRNQVQLIAYVDRLSGGGLRDLQALFDGPFAGLFGGVHLLPLFWPTFISEQVDIDVRHPAGRHYLTRILDQFHDAGIRVIRLDAVGYAVKKPGTSCFMIPETFDVITELTMDAHARGMEVLVEI